MNASRECRKHVTQKPLLNRGCTMKKNKNISLLKAYSFNSVTSLRWERLEKKLGFKVPNDYKAFIDQHGGKVWGDVESGEEVSILSPFSRTPHFSLLDLGVSLLEGYKLSFVEYLNRIPFDYSLKPGGLLPWLLTSSGDIAFLFLGNESVNGTSIIFQMSRAARYEMYLDLSCGEFSYRIASRTLQSGILPPLEK